MPTNRGCAPPPITIAGANPVVTFAANELARYLQAIGGVPVAVRQIRAWAPADGGIWLGSLDTAGDAAPAAVRRAAADGADSIAVQVSGGRGTITGANPRSVLFAVYRYLEELGCRWLWPGKNGERLPAVDWQSKHVSLQETPSARHRVVCIEGSCSVDHACDMVAHAAKLGLNAYFLQFKTSREFFKRWYVTEAPTPREDFTMQEAAAARERVKQTALERGMDLHVMGHGWTCEPFGIESEGWERSEAPPPESARPHLARIDGQRSYYRGVPLNTNLCYGNPETRRLMAEAVARYCAEHPDEQYVHVWLADGTNNHCECEACVQRRPSDWYVMILNDIDRRLAKLGLPTRIVFLAYVDLLWGPEREIIANPDRFLLMFAPITRSFERSLTDGSDHAIAEIPPFRRNQLEFPDDPRANLALLDTWKRAFSGERILFDYHLWQAHHHYPGQIPLARVLHRDTAGLGEIGMSGFIGCQAQRVAFPTGIWQYVMGKGLWDSSTAFDAVADAYFAAVYGERASAVRDYLEAVSDLFAGAFTETTKLPPGDAERIVQNLRSVAQRVDSAAPLIAAGSQTPDRQRAAAWAILRHHAWYLKTLAEFHARRHEGDPSARDVLHHMAERLQDLLPDVGHLLDTTICLHQMRTASESEG